MKEKMDIKQLIQKIGVTRFIVIVLAGMHFWCFLFHQVL